jgi:formate hydrogenlyase subunit 4
MDKITRTKLAMLVTLVLMNIFTTIALCYTMTVSNILALEAETDPFALNMAMIFAIVIAFMWVITLILFYEFKTDDAIKSRIHVLETHILELEKK